MKKEILLKEIIATIDSHVNEYIDREAMVKDLEDDINIYASQHGVSGNRQIIMNFAKWLHERDFTDPDISITEWCDNYLSACAIQTNFVFQRCPHCQGTGIDHEIPNYEAALNSSPAVASEGQEKSVSGGNLCLHQNVIFQDDKPLCVDCGNIP